MSRLIYTINKEYDETMLQAMFESKITSFRINLSRTSNETCKMLVEQIRTIECLAGVRAFIEVDVPGIKIRVAKMKSECYQIGEEVRIVLQHAYDSELFCPGECVRIGKKGLSVTIDASSNGVITGKVETSGMIQSHDPIICTRYPINNTVLTKSDRERITYISKLDIDAIALSYVESEKVIHEARELIKASGAKRELEIIAKIETTVGIEQYPNIVEVSDGIMVGRGDMMNAVGLKRTNQFIQQVEMDWHYETKKLLLATNYFFDFLFREGEIDPNLFLQDKKCVFAFISDESSYGDWRKISNKVNQIGLFSGV